jgi:hypothetical protein
VVCSSLSITTDILQPDAQFDHMVMTLSHDRIKKYLAKVTRQLEQFCSRGSHNATPVIVLGNWFDCSRVAERLA